MDGARLLALIAKINSWPAAIFVDLKYKNNYYKIFLLVYFCLSYSVDHHLLTFHVLDNAYQINASNVASAASKLCISELLVNEVYKIVIASCQSKNVLYLYFFGKYI